MKKKFLSLCALIILLSGCTIYRPIYNGGIHSEWYLRKNTSEKKLDDFSRRLQEPEGLAFEFPDKEINTLTSEPPQASESAILSSETSQNLMYYASSEKIPDLATKEIFKQASVRDNQGIPLKVVRNLSESPIHVPDSYFRLLDDELPVHPLSRKSLAFGIVGLIFPLVGLPFSILALVFGIRGLIKTVRYSDEYSGRGVAIAGIITGGVGIFLAFVGLVVLLALLVGY